MGPFEDLPRDLMEEYKLCQEKAQNMQNNIWKTASILGAGSIVGIVGLWGRASSDNVTPYVSIIVSCLAIVLIVTWYRFARRWSSIEQAMIVRMIHIERQSKRIRANLYVGYLDDLKKAEDTGKKAPKYFSTTDEEPPFTYPFLAEEILKDLKDNKRLRDYEYRGLVPMIKCSTRVTVAAWVVLLLLQVLQLHPWSRVWTLWMQYITAVFSSNFLFTILNLTDSKSQGVLPVGG